MTEHIAQLARAAQLCELLPHVTPLRSTELHEALQQAGLRLAPVASLPEAQVDLWDGIPSASHPTGYHGIALMVLRDPEGRPVAAWDGNGMLVYRAAGYDHVKVDWRSPRSHTLPELLGEAVR